MHSRVLHDLPYDLWLKRTTMCEDPVGLIVGHGPPLTILLFHHLLHHRFPILVARRGHVRPLLDPLNAEYLERPHSCRCLRVEWLRLEAEALGYIWVCTHQNVVKEPTEYPRTQPHRFCCQTDVLHHRAWRIGLNLEDEFLQGTDEHRHLELTLAVPFLQASRLLCGIVERAQVPDIK